MNFRRLLFPALLLAAIVAPAAHAQSTTNCPYQFLCINPNSSLSAQANTPGAIAMGDGAVAGTAGSGGNEIAVGDMANATNGGIAVGANTVANGGIAIGASANASNGSINILASTQAGGTGYVALNGTAGTAGVSVGTGSVGGNYSTSVGWNAYSLYSQTSLLGAGTVGLGNDATAAGYQAQAGANATAVGSLANASGAGSFAGGWQAAASGASSIALLGTAAAPNSMAFGVGSNVLAGATGSIAFAPLTSGSSVSRLGVFDVGGRQISSVAAGTLPTDAVNLQQLDAAIAGVGGGSAPVWLASTDTTTPASALGTNGTAVGAGSAAGNANTSYNTAVGINAAAGTQGTAAAGTGGQDTAVGYGASATGIGAESFGYQASATAPFSTAIGNYALADQANTVSFGNDTTGVTRRLVNVSPGINSSDAMTMGQGQTVTSIFGGGANLLTNTAPTYLFTSPYAAGTYYDVGSALTALDNGQNALWNAFNNLPTGGGTQGPQGPAGQNGTGANVIAGNNIVVTKDTSGNDVVSTVADPTFNSVTASSSAGKTVVSASGVTITPSNGSSVSLTDQGLDNGGNVIRNVGAGTAPTDAVNVGQLTAGINNAENWAKDYTDSQVAGLRDQIARVGAEQAASAALAGNYRDTPNSFAAGVGFQGGHNAIAVGYRHISESRRVSWSIQGAISGGERSIGVGIGYGW
jgi:hypothetical protein